MKTDAKVVVIGGGVVGVSALYHLAKKGWGDDVVLLEKAELTSGSTWHAAGLLPLFNMSYSVGQVHKYSVNLYRELEAETGQPVGFSQVGNLRLAMNQDRMDEYSQYAATARTIGINVEFLTPDQIGKLWPLCNTDGLVGIEAAHRVNVGRRALDQFTRLLLIVIAKRQMLQMVEHIVLDAQRDAFRSAGCQHTTEERKNAPPC